MRERLEQRLQNLRAEFARGQQQMADLEAQLRQARAERRRMAEIEAKNVRVPEQEKAKADLQITLADQQLVAARAQQQVGALVAVDEVRDAGAGEGVDAVGSGQDR